MNKAIHFCKILFKKKQKQYIHTPFLIYIEVSAIFSVILWILDVSSNYAVR